MINLINYELQVTSMQNIIQQYKPLIDAQAKELASNNQLDAIPWSFEVTQSLVDTTLRGKTVRGSLILATIDLFNPPFDKNAITVATAIEYLHTALLIHDDLVDHDELRRGFPSMFKEYEEKGIHKNATNPQEFGKAMALCIGDIAIFYAFSLLNSLTLESNLHRHILQLVTKEFVIVGFGELHDIALGYLPNIPTSKEVIDMYTRKTARYTFSVPMMIGAILSKQPAEIITTMDALGEKLGLMFQLTDDQLTLTGNVETVGKSIGNDISENKKTLYHVLLREKATTEDNKLLDSIFGKKSITQKDIELVRQLVTKYNVESHINDQIQKLTSESLAIIQSLPLTQENINILLQMVSMFNKRSK